MEIRIKKDQTIDKLINEFQLPYVLILLEVNGEIFYPDRIKSMRITKGDRVVFIPLIAGG